MEKNNLKEVTKLQEHLSLLRNEYVRLQTKHAELEAKYSIAVASTGQKENTFIGRLLKSISDLYGQSQNSDLTIRLDDETIPAHKFVLLARSQIWGVPNLNEVNELDWSHFRHNTGRPLLRWVYTGQLDSSDTNICLLSLMKVANNFQLIDLVDNCESSLISSIDRSNCIKFYMTASEISAFRLKDHCSALMSTHWNDFTKDDFKFMPADILGNMLKSKSRFPLHDAIRIEREDVVFLNLVEGNNTSRINEVDENNHLPLDVALQSKQQYIAKSLVENGAGLNVLDREGRSPLHKAILRCDTDAVEFLLEHGADPSLPWSKTGEAPVHLVCRGSSSCAEKLLKAGCDINAQTIDGKTPLHVCVETQNEEVLELILTSKSVDLDCTTSDGVSALWLALKLYRSEPKFAEMLIKAGASPNNVRDSNHDSLLHRCAEEGEEAAGIFLCGAGANANHINMNGESPLHTACRKGLSLLVSELLKHRADPTLAVAGTGDSAVHIAIKHGHVPCVLAILEETRKLSKSDLMTILNLKNSDGLTPLGASLDKKSFELAANLVQCGSDVNAVDLCGETLLNRFIKLRNTEAVTFLLECKETSSSTGSQSSTSSLLLAVEYDLPEVVDALCKKGYDMSVVNANGDCLLWAALQKPSTHIASVLVRFGIDTDCWVEGPDGQYRTLLHRSIIEKNEEIACFLIQAGCDVNATRGLQKDGADLATPLHLCAELGLTTTVICLLSHGVQVNVKGPDGKTPLHLAIQKQHQDIVTLLLEHPSTDLSIRDKSGHSPFATAMLCKNNKAAQFILSKYPTAAEQYNARGRNYLHESISEVNIENVMFLLSINVDVNSRTKDTKMFSSLHLAVEAKSELLVRNLLLAGANIHERTPQKWTPLHIASEKGDANIVSVLLDNGADIAAVDNEHNNALSIAVKHGNYQVCKVLLLESHINAESVNLKGQNPLHLLARYGKENAVDILTLFLECMPDYPVNNPDVDGNTPLLLAYINGNGDLCRALVKNNAALGAMNKDGITIFNYQVPTRQLLYRLLDYLTEEPPWVDGDVCLECGVKFSITVRKHHCRHCGRLLCNSCSGKDIPIVKFNLNKPVRVCGICFDVLALGGAMV